MNPDLTAPTGAVRSGSTLFDQEASKTFQQITKADDLIFALMLITFANSLDPEQVR